MRTNIQIRNECYRNLKNWIKEGDTIYYVIKQVSSSGMYRHIDFYKFDVVDGKIVKSWLSYNIAKALDYPFKEKTNSVGVGGCGMNMAFHVISQVATSLFGDYKKLKYEAL
jgi:hypothetical protein